MNPGRTADVDSFTSLYSPKTGARSDIYGNGVIYCAGNNCGADLIGGGARDGTGSGSQTISHDSNAGRTLVDTCTLRATLTPTGATYRDDVKTGTAKCGTGSNRNCTW